MLRESGSDYFNPDEIARKLRAAQPYLTQAQANSAAWHAGRRLLERAISERLDYAFESTLGATTIPRLLLSAAQEGFEVRVWYVGLESPELHLARVRARVARGGHDIAEEQIRRRWDSSRLNLIRLLPYLAELKVFDNSLARDPTAGLAPKPRLILHVRERRIVAPRDLASTPEWAKPIVAAALKLRG